MSAHSSGEPHPALSAFALFASQKDQAANASESPLENSGSVFLSDLSCCTIERMLVKKIVSYLKQFESSGGTPDLGVDKTSFVNWVMKQEKGKKKVLTRTQVVNGIEDGLYKDNQYIGAGKQIGWIKTTTRGRRILDRFGWTLLAADFLRPIGTLGATILGVVGLLSLLLTALFNFGVLRLPANSPTQSSADSALTSTSTTTAECPIPLVVLTGNSQISGNTVGAHFQVCSVAQETACKLLLKDSSSMRGNGRAVEFEVIDCNPHHATSISTSTTGIQCGGSNGPMDCGFKNMTITGFGTGIHNKRCVYHRIPRRIPAQA